MITITIKIKEDPKIPGRTSGNVDAKSSTEDPVTIKERLISNMIFESIGIIGEHMGQGKGQNVSIRRFTANKENE